ncbi:hypothetical protein D3C76_1448040 [compost metagenome]
MAATLQPGCACAIYLAAATADVQTSSVRAEMPIASKCAATSSGVREELLVTNRKGIRLARKAVIRPSAPGIIRGP